jgi:hypothetical protein
VPRKARKDGDWKLTFMCTSYVTDPELDSLFAVILLRNRFNEVLHASYAQRQKVLESRF